MSEALLNLFDDLSVSENIHKLAPLITNITEHIEASKQNSTLEKKADLIEKLLRKIFFKEKLVAAARENEIYSQLVTLMNNQIFKKLDLFGILLRLLELLESEKSSQYKIEFDRKKLYESLVQDTLINYNEFAKFCAETISLSSSDEYNEILNSLFSYPNKVSNYLEGCPQDLKPDNFYISLLHTSIIENKSELREKKFDYFLSMINKLIVNGQSSNLDQSFYLLFRTIGIILVQNSFRKEREII